MGSKKGWILTAALLMACGPLAGQVGAGGVSAVYPENFCSNTAINALRACESKANDEFWVMRGQCENYFSIEDRLACRTGKRIA